MRNGHVTQKECSDASACASACGARSRAVLGPRRMPRRSPHSRVAVGCVGGKWLVVWEVSGWLCGRSDNTGCWRRTCAPSVAALIVGRRQ
eukprot:366527-Chlamydomonas_euryale.AAC.6